MVPSKVTKLVVCLVDSKVALMADKKDCHAAVVKVANLAVMKDCRSAVS